MVTSDEVIELLDTSDDEVQQAEDVVEEVRVDCAVRRDAAPVGDEDDDLIVTGERKKRAPSTSTLRVIAPSDFSRARRRV